MHPTALAFVRRNRQWLTVALFLVVLLAAFQWLGLRGQISIDFVQQQIRSHQVGGLLIFALLFSLGNLIQIPGWLFLAAAALTLGRVNGGLATYVAAMTSCIITFVVIRFIGGDAVRRLDSTLAQRILRRFDAQPLVSVTLLRTVFQTLPALNYVLAMSGVRFRDYIAGSAIGLVVPITLYCLFFDFLARLAGWPTT